MLDIDKQFIFKLNTSSIPMKDKGAGVFMFRCPLCGDSKKNQHKARGYLFPNPSLNIYWYTCHNCFQGNTTVLTREYGIVPFSEIVGKNVHVKTIEGIWRQSVVKSYGEQDLYKYKFRNKKTKLDETEVIATENHRWLILNQECKSKEKRKKRPFFITEHLQVGDTLVPSVSIFGKTERWDAIIHGLIFGDGVIVRKKYAHMRICKQDKTKEIILEVIKNAGLHVTYPPRFKGDAALYVGNRPHFKSLPETVDPDYIEGFIYGWWLADGHKSKKPGNIIQISTTNEAAMKWLEIHAPYIGYRYGHSYLISGNRKGAYPNGKPLHIVTLSKASMTVVSKEYYGREKVFCIEEPITHSFVLGNGLLTGNCFANQPFSSLLKTVDAQLYSLYRKETFTNTKEYHAPPAPVIEGQQYVDQLISIKNLASMHPAKRYCITRKIPDAFYTPKFKTWAEQFAPDKVVKLDDTIQFIIFVLKSKDYVLGFQGRLISEKGPRYVNISLRDSPLVYGIDTVDANLPFYITEGIIDCLHLPNSIATLNGNLSNIFRKLGLPDNGIHCLDNEKLNPHIVREYHKTIKNGHKIFIWPNEVQAKDFNELAVKYNYTNEQIKELVDRNTYSGARAELAFSQWRNS